MSAAHDGAAHEPAAEAGPVIGFVGLGNMGGPMCRRLLGAGYAVVGFDRVDATLGALVADGAEGADSAADCAAAADFLLTSLPRPDHVLSVMRGSGALDALAPGTVWVDLTTNRRELVVELAAARPDVGIVDSPVTGAVDGARNGQLTLFAGGDPVARARVLPILSHLGRVIECGPLGTGNIVKLVTNQLWFIHAAALGEALALGMTHGVELDVLYEAVLDSVADSFVARHDAPSIFAGHYDPSFSLDLCLKDLGLIRELSDPVASDLPLTEAATRAFVRAGDRYGLDAGEMHVARHIEDDTGLSFRIEGDWPPPWER